MSKKKGVKVVSALCMAAALTFGATACDAFITTNSDADLKQVVATVNISSRLSEEQDVRAAAIQALVDMGGLRTDVPKRDLIAFYMSTGYQYVESYGYEATFNMLLDSLVDRKVMVQYAMAYYLDKLDPTPADKTDSLVDGCIDYVQDALDSAEGVAKNHPEVFTLQYFLTNGGKGNLVDENNTKDYDKAVYNLKKSVNDSLDSAEKSYIKEKSDLHEHGEVRTLPTGAGAEKSDYYVAPVEEVGGVKAYEIYNGFNDESACYGYEALDGSTKVTRLKAYNSFLRNLQNNDLIKEGEDTTDFTKMDYYYVELANQLEVALITKYTEDLEKEAEDELLRNDPNSYVDSRYNETKAKEKEKYDENESAFEEALNGLSDTTLPLYSPKAGYGLVYNILIPFSASQNDKYTAEQARDRTDTELATYRANLLMDVQSKDLRTSWFSEHEDHNYAYASTGASGVDYYGTESNYLFFEDNYTNTEKYEEIGQYLGKYAFNGTVTKTDDKFTVKAKKMGIDAFIAEMEAYMAFATGKTVSGDKYDKYVGPNGLDNNGNPYDYDVNLKKFNDYSQFMYYTGKVNFAAGDVSADNYFVKDTVANKAVSAFNELMFAYSTDTGCLNTYMGYVVSPYKTSFVPEFEYAAQYAIRELGVGGYVVCPSTYGWHIIYVTHVYGEGDVYEGFKKDQKDTDGTFSQLYFDKIKESFVGTYAQKVQDNALKAYNTDSTVVRYPDRYKNLTELG